MWRLKRLKRIIEGAVRDERLGCMEGENVKSVEGRSLKVAMGI